MQKMFFLAAMGLVALINSQAQACPGICYRPVYGFKAPIFKAPIVAPLNAAPIGGPAVIPGSPAPVAPIGNAAPAPAPIGGGVAPGPCGRSDCRRQQHGDPAGS